MIILAALTGIVVGYGINWASDALPQLARKDRSSDARPASATEERLGAGAHRSWKDLAAPFVSGVIFAVWEWQYGLSMKAIGLAGLSTFLLLVALIDLKHRLILNVMIYPALILTLIFRLVVFRHELLPTLIGGVMAFSIFYLTALIRPGDLGGGDVKLAALFGLGFGFPTVLWVLLIGVLLGGIGAAIFLTRKSTPKHIAYAPYLCFGALIALIHSPF